MKIMPRRLQALGKGAPTVESRLDDFIERANEELLDITDFGPGAREEREAAAKAEAEHREAIVKAEGALREKLLKQRVEQLEQRIIAMKSKRKPSQGWGKLVIGFVLGCGAMFAVGALMPRDSAAPATTATSAPSAAPTPPQPPAPIAVTPIEEPAPAPAPPAVTEPSTPPPAEPLAAPAPVEKPAKKARRHTTTTPSQPTAQPKPPESKGSGDLYNPF
jgi:hypothetical protein